MSRRETRLAALEVRKRVASQKVHRVFYREGDTDAATQANREAALDAYGRGLIGPDDMVIEVMGVAPRFDENGKIIPRVSWRAATSTEGE